ncbi:MAG: hypothetical protein FD180_2806 [Planctomycetota bacterium]|nr:MAG: hypothetical protein FD180_2806 [Planctomycetota bacterium]
MRSRREGRSSRKELSKLKARRFRFGTYLKRSLHEARIPVLRETDQSTKRCSPELPAVGAVGCEARHFEGARKGDRSRCLPGVRRRKGLDGPRGFPAGAPPTGLRKDGEVISKYPCGLDTCPHIDSAMCSVDHLEADATGLVHRDRFAFALKTENTVAVQRRLGQVVIPKLSTHR